MTTFSNHPSVCQYHLTKGTKRPRPIALLHFCPTESDGLLSFKRDLDMMLTERQEKKRRKQKPAAAADQRVSPKIPDPGSASRGPLPTVRQTRARGG